MICFDDCHYYELSTVMGEVKQFLVFYEMRKDGTRFDGVTNEEVLEALVHRLRCLNKAVPCTENEMAIKNLEGAQVWLTLRTQDRKSRKVEGTHAR